MTKSGRSFLRRIAWLAKGIADVQSGKIKEIRDAIGMETNEFNPYRKRL